MRAPRHLPCRARLAIVATLALVFGVACGPAKLEAKPGGPATPVTQAEIKGVNLSAARELDQQGARAFAEGRYREAARYFEEAFGHGGPPHELWNMARCQQKLDDFEGAARLLERYIEQERISLADREDGRRELAEVLRKPSRVTMITVPPGASVIVDDRRATTLGRTPLTVEVSPGEHVLTLELAGHEVETQRITARYGRSIVVEATLSK